MAFIYKNLTEAALAGLQRTAPLSERLPTTELVESATDHDLVKTHTDIVTKALGDAGIAHDGIHVQHPHPAYGDSHSLVVVKHDPKVSGYDIHAAAMTHGAEQGHFVGSQSLSTSSLGGGSSFTMSRYKPEHHKSYLEHKAKKEADAARWNERINSSRGPDGKFPTNTPFHQTMREVGDIVAKIKSGEIKLPK